MPDDLKTPALEMAEKVLLETPRPHNELETVKAARCRQFATALLEAQAKVLEPYCECLEFENKVCSVCCKITALRAAAEEVTNG